MGSKHQNAIFGIGTFNQLVRFTYSGHDSLISNQEWNTCMVDKDLLFQLKDATKFCRLVQIDSAEQTFTPIFLTRSKANEVRYSPALAYINDIKARLPCVPSCLVLPR